MSVPMSALPSVSPTYPVPRVWVGCVACYAAGRLVGEWNDAIHADEVSCDDLHRANGLTVIDEVHKETWVYDHENLPMTGECSPADAARLGRRIAEADEWLREAFIAWIGTGNIIEDADHLPDLESFIETYAGHWPSFRDFAEQQVDDLGILDGVPELVQRYFDYDEWASDLTYEYDHADALDGGVFVFRNL